MSISFRRDLKEPFIADINGSLHNFVIDTSSGLALPWWVFSDKRVVALQTWVKVAAFSAAETGATPNAADNVKLPRDAIIILPWWFRVISQDWLARQAPPSEFGDEGGTVFNEENQYLPEMSSENNMQCWVKHGLFYWNDKGLEWLVQYYGWTATRYEKLMKIYRESCMWQNHLSGLRSMWSSWTGWFDHKHGNVIRPNEVFLPSSTDTDTPKSHKRILTFNHSELNFSVKRCDLSYKDGVVPFILLDK